MAALSALSTTEDAKLVFQKAEIALAGGKDAVSGAALAFSGAAQNAFRALKAHLSQVKRNPNLRFTAISAEDLVTANDGLGVGAGTARIYGVFLKKRDDATDSFISVVDDGTDDNYYGGSLTGSVRVQTAALEAKEEFIALYPKGLSMANGIRVVTTTAAAAGTTVSVAAADSVDGFIISGDA